MRPTRLSEADLVAAAQAGDRRACDELAAAYLPFVYNIVGRALSGQPDVDDVVQETMLRALRQLPSLRAPQSFRAWLAAIAVHQVSTHRHRRRTVAARSVPLDDAGGLVDADADFEVVTVLRLGLSGQRRQAVLASRWLEADDRTLLSLWWLEAIGQLTRRDLAIASGVTVAHAGVRIQRMLNRLEASRMLVAALEAQPRCPGLDAVLAGWNRRPNSVWRKRTLRHIRSCDRCSRSSDALVPTPQLLAGLALVPAPLVLAAAVTAKSGSVIASVAATGAAVGSGAVKAGFASQLAHAVVAHPVASMVAATAIAVGTAVTATTLSPAAPPATIAIPAATPGVPLPPIPGSASITPSPQGAATIRLGPASLESVDQLGRFIAYTGDLGGLARVAAGSPASDRQRATFRIVAGLADRECVSLRANDGRYVRHSSWRLRLSADDGTVLFREDATFCAGVGSMAGTVTLESLNYPGRYLRHVGTILWVDPSDGTSAFRDSSSFHIRTALGA